MVAVIILHRFTSADGGPSYLSHQDVSGRVCPRPIIYQDVHPSSGQNHYKRAFSLSGLVCCLRFMTLKKKKKKRSLVLSVLSL